MQAGQTDLYTLVAIAGLIAITVVTRSFFFISNKTWTLPNWAERGLAYAPIAALAAVIGPEVLLRDGVFAATWQDARIYGAVVGAAWFFWRRGVLGTIVCGMAVFLPLRLMLGW